MNILSLDMTPVPRRNIVLNEAVPPVDPSSVDSFDSPFNHVGHLQARKQQVERMGGDT